MDFGRRPSIFVRPFKPPTHPEAHPVKTCSRRAVVALLALVLTLIAALPAVAQEPLLTLVLSGNTYGNYEPCPS